MARPRKDAPGKPALERMDEAYWALLEETPFDSITIADLSRKAGVNHNTFYYYYNNLEDLAKACFERNLSSGLMSTLIGFVLGTNTEDAIEALPDDFKVRYRRFCLYARGDSQILNKLIKESLTNKLFEQANKKPEDISTFDQISFDYMVGGFIAVLNNEAAQENPLLLIEKANLEPGISLIHAMRTILA